MKEAIGNSFVMGLVITFLIIFMLLFATSLSYTKAFKVKNKIIEIIEKYDDIYDIEVSKYNNNRLDNNVEKEINDALSQIGYRISVTPNICPERNGAQPINKNTNYEYCIYKYETSKGNYYGVTSYIYYEIPVIGTRLRFPVYGETKISGILG